jgi:hypothetical protein
MSQCAAGQRHRDPIQPGIGGATEGIVVNGNGLGATFEGAHEIVRQEPLRWGLLAGDDLVAECGERVGEV